MAHHGAVPCTPRGCIGGATSQNRYSAKCHGTGRCRGTGASRLFDWPKKGRGALHPEGVHDVGIAVRANSCYPVLLKGRKGIPGSHIARVNRRVLYLSGGEFRRSTPLLLDPPKFGDGQVSERWRNGGRRAWYSSHWGSPSYGVNHAFVSGMPLLVAICRATTGPSCQHCQHWILDSRHNSPLPALSRESRSIRS